VALALHPDSSMRESGRALHAAGMRIRKLIAPARGAMGRALPAILLLPLGWTGGLSAGQLVAAPASPIADVVGHSDPGSMRGIERAAALIDWPGCWPSTRALVFEPVGDSNSEFRAYDRDARHVGTLFVMTLAERATYSSFSDILLISPPATHVDLCYHSGHERRPEPHYHLVVWHIWPERLYALR
jgi:hypothetical protein